MKRILGLITLFVLAAVLTVPAFAASQNAVVYGTVYDNNGTPTAGVQVTLANAGLGFTRTAITGSDGSYDFAEVPPSEDYIITASKGGRVLDIRAGITVNVGDERVILPPLKDQQPVVTAVATTPTTTATTSAGGTATTTTTGGTKTTTPTTTTTATTASAGTKTGTTATTTTVATTGAGKVEPIIRRVAGQSLRNETISSAVSGVVTGEQLRSLPLYNRNFLVLGALTPNTKDAQQGSELAGASFSVAGQRPSSNNFLLDGSDNVASSSNQAVPFQVNEAIQEFRVISATAPAEYGRNQGGIVNIVTRRASNAFHGSLFAYWGWDGFNGSNPLSAYTGTTFDRAAGYAGPVNSTYTGPFPLTYNDYVNSGAALGNHCSDQITASMGSVNPCFTGGQGEQTRFNPAAILATHDSHLTPFESEQFGGSLGGAIVKDKIFLYGSYEGTMIDNPTPIFERVPTQFDRTYNPLLAGGVPNAAAYNFGNSSPDYLLGQNIIGLFPRSNVAAVPGVLEFFQGEAPNYTDVHNYLGRADIVQSSNTNWTIRYVAQMLNQLHDDTLPVNKNYPGNGAYRDVFNQNLNVGYTHNFTNSFINEVRGGFNRFNVKETPQDSQFDATTVGFANSALPTLSLNGLDTQSSGQTPGQLAVHNGIGVNWRDSVPNFPTMDYLFPYARLGAPLNAPSSRLDTTAFAEDGFSWSHGKHGIKGGFSYRHLGNEIGNAGLARTFIYSSNIGEFTSDSESCNGGCSAGNAFARPSFDFAQSQAPYRGDFNSFALAFYLQDTWRIHRRLTLNYGLRYEYFSVPSEAHNNVWNYDPTANGLVQQGTNTTVDQFGNACGTVPTTDPSLPGSIGAIGSSLGFTTAANPNPKGWNCSAGSSTIAESDKNNFAPRVGLAWDISGNAKTVLRVGYGLYYDQSPASYTTQLLMNRPTTAPNAQLGQVFVPGVLAAGFCNGVALSGAECGAGSSILDPTVQAASFDGVNPNSFYTAVTQPYAIYARDTAHSATPYSQQISGSIQQSMGNHVGFEVGYVGAWGDNLPLVYNSNFNREWDTANLFSDQFSYSPIFTLTNQGHSEFNSFSAKVRLAGIWGLKSNFTYSYSRSNDNASNSVFPNLPITGSNQLLSYGYFLNGSNVPGCLYDPTSVANCPAGVVPVTPTIDFSGGAVTTTGSNPVIVSRYLLPQDPNHVLTNEWGPSDFDSRNKFVIDYVWDIPSPKHGFGKLVGGNWQIAGIYTLQSGQPFTVFSPLLGEITQRASVQGLVQQDNNNPNDAISIAHFSLAPNSATCSSGVTNGYKLVPTTGTACIGNSERNGFIGPHYNNLNMSVQKGFHVFGEGRMIVLRSEFYNIVDTANYYNPISTISLNGSVPYGDFGKIKSAHDPRQVQFAVRFTW